MRSTVPTPAAAVLALLVGALLFVELYLLWEHPVISGAVATAATSWLLFCPDPDRFNDDVCAGCDHRRVEHHGICQACQRDVVRGVPGAPTHACERFTPPGTHEERWPSTS